MKKVSLVLGLVLLCSVAASAQTVSGAFRYETAQGTQTIEFEARSLGERATGGLAYHGPVDIPVIDVDGDDAKEGGRFSDYALKVDIDCMVVFENRASLSGLVIDAADRNAIGRRMIIAVEDNGGREPDRYGWGLYKDLTINWIPADAELKEDDGWFLTWWASDAERKDDEPVLINRNPNVDCSSFPLVAYELADVEKESGDIRISQ